MYVGVYVLYIHILCVSICTYVRACDSWQRTTSNTTCSPVDDSGARAESTRARARVDHTAATRLSCETTIQAHHVYDRPPTGVLKRRCLEISRSLPPSPLPPSRPLLRASSVFVQDNQSTTTIITTTTTIPVSTTTMMSRGTARSRVIPDPIGRDRDDPPPCLPGSIRAGSSMEKPPRENRSRGASRKREERRKLRRAGRSRNYGCRWAAPRGALAN